MRLSELMRRHVVTESGDSLGRIHDVCAEQRGSRLVVTGIIVGPKGWLEHFGMHFRHGSQGGKRRVSAPAIPWSRVVRVGDRVVVRDGALDG